MDGCIAPPPPPDIAPILPPKLPAPPASPLMLADRLLTLAQDADRAGYRAAAAHLVTLVYDVLDTHQH